MLLQALVEIFTMHSFALLWNHIFSKKLLEICQKNCEILEKNSKNSAIFNENLTIRERCKGVHCVDLGESFPTSIYLMKSASIQPRTSSSKFYSKLFKIIQYYSIVSLDLGRWHRVDDIAQVPRNALGFDSGGSSRQIWNGSFSAVSKRNFASKYAFERSRRDLHNALFCNALKSHFCQQIVRT